MTTAEERCSGRGAMAGCEAGEALARRVLCQLVERLAQQPTPKSFEIVPVEINQSNKSPLLQIDDHMGLESWCIKYVYNYAYNTLMDEYLSRRKINNNNHEAINTLLIGVLLINPDVMTFWNKRREMVTKNFLDPLVELKFTRLVLSHKPKSNETFSYRKWLLQKCFSDPDFPIYHKTVLIDDDNKVTEISSEKCSNNYHAWSHRIWLMKLLSKDHQLSVMFPSDVTNLREFFNVEEWITTHISDYSGLHYRQYCLANVLNIKNYLRKIDTWIQYRFKKTLNQFLADNLEAIDLVIEDENCDEKKMVDIILGVTLDTKPDSGRDSKIYQNICLLIYELKLNEYLSKLYSAHETLWCHRRFILQHLMSLMYQYFGEIVPNINSTPSLINEKHVSSEFVGNITRNFANMHKKSKGIDIYQNLEREPKIPRPDNHSIYNSLLYRALKCNERKFIDHRIKCKDKYSKKYEVWLRVILNFPF